MYPHFMCIGAQKAGTTWLYENLRQHPQIWFPPIKEIHHFNRPKLRPRILRLSDPKFSKEFKQVISQFRQGQPWKWYLTYFLFPNTERWYASLFRPANKQIAGDMTPYYSHLNKKIVTKIHTLMPDLKIIYLLRNPIDRLWSQSHMPQRKQKFEELIQGNYTEEEFQAWFFQQENHHRNSNYLSNLQRWEAVYPQDQIFIGFFEQLSQEPEQLLSAIYKFLAVNDSAQYIPHTAFEKINKGPDTPIPPHWAVYATDLYYDQLVGLHQRFKNQSTATWLAKADQLLMPKKINRPIYQAYATYLWDRLKPSTPKQTKFILFFRARSGSHLLRDLLNNHPAIFCDSEIYAKHKIGRVHFPQAYLQCKQRVYGFTISVKHLARDQGIEPAPYLGQLVAAGWKIIYLRRENLLLQAISIQIALLRGKWQDKTTQALTGQKFHLNCIRLLKDLNRLAQDYQKELNLLAEMPHHPLIYEQHLLHSEDHQTTMTTVFDYLGLPPHPVKSAYQRITSDNLTDLLENYEEVLNCVQQSHYAHFLEEI